MSTCICLITSVICVVALVANVSCRTILLNGPPSKEELGFLTKYGYLPERSMDLDFVYTSKSISEAVSLLQEFAGLPQTGQFDFATKQLFKKKRCGVKDVDHSEKSRNRRYILQQGWNKKTINYRVINGSSTLSKERVEAVMAEALAVWAPHGGLRFTQLHDGHADIEVSFVKENHGDGFPFDGLGHVVAHAFPPPHGAMHFDDDELWGEDEHGQHDDVTDFFAVAVHEIGHALGLSHSNVKGSVMYPYYQVPVEKLHLDDISGMAKLYLTDEIPEEPVAPETESPQVGGSSLVPRFTKAMYTDSDADGDELEENEIPELCYTYYNTIQAIQGKLFVFEEEWMWVINDKVIEEGYPRRFHEVFKGLPERVNYIKSIYEKQNGNIVIFFRKKYWEFDSKFRLKKVGKLTDYSIPGHVHELTTVFLSNYNNKTYLIEEERFWRFDEATWTMDKGYPKDMSAWRDIPYPVDAALIWKGDTFFFHGPRYWRFDNTMVQAHPYYPLPTAQIWFPCPPTSDMKNYFSNERP